MHCRILQTVFVINNFWKICTIFQMNILIFGFISSQWIVDCTGCYIMFAHFQPYAMFGKHSIIIGFNSSLHVYMSVTSSGQLTNIILISQFIFTTSSVVRIACSLYIFCSLLISPLKLVCWKCDGHDCFTEHLFKKDRNVNFSSWLVYFLRWICFLHIHVLQSYMPWSCQWLAILLCTC